MFGLITQEAKILLGDASIRCGSTKNFKFLVRKKSLSPGQPLQSEDGLVVTCKTLPDELNKVLNTTFTAEQERQLLEICLRRVRKTIFYTMDKVT